MTPYYADEHVELFLGDCREILPEISTAHMVVVTDPPYGIDINPVRSRFDRIVGDKEPFDPRIILDLGLPTVMFGANHFASRLPDSPTWFVWDKRGATPSNLQADCELAWSNLGGPARLVRYYWNGGGSKNREAKGTRKGSLHATQKPEGVMRWIIERCPAGTILDPFMGSGSTVVAAKQVGRKAIGIEIEERYCEIAANRCRQETLGLTA